MKPLRVAFDHAVGPALAARVSAARGVDVRLCPDETSLAAALGESDVLWHVLRPCTAGTIASAPRLRLIQKIGIGVNTIDLAAAQARGIAVCTLPGTNSRAVAEMALLLMLATLRRLPAVDSALRAGAWIPPLALQDGFGELGGRTVGLIGYGAVPAILAPVLAALGCRVLYTDKLPRPDAVVERRPLAELLAESDIVSLHVPLVAETERMIDAAALARCKLGAVLINTARGGLIDEAALLAALRSGQLAAAGLDVFADEPPAPDNPLLALPNVVVTPHVSWLTGETFARSLSLATENCRRLAAGEELLHRVC